MQLTNRGIGTVHVASSASAVHNLGIILSLLLPYDIDRAQESGQGQIPGHLTKLHAILQLCY